MEQIKNPKDETKIKVVKLDITPEDRSKLSDFSFYNSIKPYNNLDSNNKQSKRKLNYSIVEDLSDVLENKPKNTSYLMKSNNLEPNVTMGRPSVKKINLEANLEMPSVKKINLEPQLEMPSVKKINLEANLEMPSVKKINLEPNVEIPSVKKINLEPNVEMPALKDVNLGTHLDMPDLKDDNLGPKLENRLEMDPIVEFDDEN